MSDGSYSLGSNEWMMGWLRDHDLRSPDDASRAATVPYLFADLVSRAETQQGSRPVTLGSHGILAGRSLDLSPHLSCSHPECVRGQVNNLFSHVWHYFDQIAVVGPDAHAFLDAVHGGATGDALARGIARRAVSIFHVRDIGAESLVVWVDKPPACPVHWREYETLSELQMPEDQLRVVSSAFRKQARFELDDRDKQPSLRIRHPALYGGSQRMRLDRLLQNKMNEESVEDTAARWLVLGHWVAASADIVASNALEAPVGLGLPMEVEFYRRLRPEPTVGEVAFNLHLPVVSGVSIGELLALREQEGDAFDAFRQSLRSAMRERLKQAPDANPEVVAQEIQEDVIDPALTEITRRLSAAQEMLARKHTMNVGLASVATVAGFVGAVPLAVALGAAAAVQGVTAEAKRLEEERDARLSNMYFAWHAREYRAAKPRTRRPKRKGSSGGRRRRK